jgi:uncharacterized protein involved in exopolysaccharide biosynthesis
VAYTQADIDELKRVKASGALRAKFADREVEYRSLEELNQVLAEMEREVNGSASSYRLVSTCKGL